MKIARRLFYAVSLLLVLLVLAAVAALAAALQPEARVAQGPELALEDVTRAMSLLRTHDPRQARPGVVSTALVSSRDIEVLLSHGMQRWLKAASQVRLERGAATLHLSAHLGEHRLRMFGRWLNVELKLVETGGLPSLDRVTVGRLPVPSWLAEKAALQVVSRVGLQAEFELASDVVRRVRFNPDQLLVTYAWQGDSVGRLLNGLVPADEVARLRAYSDLLADLTMRDKSSWDLPLAQLVQPAFALAQRRSSAGNDPAAENRAALTVLTLLAVGRNVGSVVPAARSWPRPRPVRLLLAGRQDFPQHFLVSAALATESSSPLSKAIGLYKEVTDARGGSGFSFNDVAANRAGTRFGERLLQAPELMQQRLARGVADTDLVPPVQDLPEFMPEAEFVRRFGGVGAPAYNTLLADIDRRIAALPLLR